MLLCGSACICALGLLPDLVAIESCDQATNWQGSLLCSSSSESLLSATAETIVLMHSPVIGHRPVAIYNILLYLSEAGTARHCWLQHSSTLASHDFCDVHPLQTVEPLQNIDALHSMGPFIVLLPPQHGSLHNMPPPTCCLLFREAQAMAANADISRRKAERRAQKLDKEVSHLQTQLTNHQRCTSSSPTSLIAWTPYT